MQLALMKFDSMYEISECHLQSPFFRPLTEALRRSFSVWTCDLSPRVTGRFALRASEGKKTAAITRRSPN